MQKQRATKTIVVGCLLVGVLAGAAAAQVAEAVFRVQFLNTSLFTMNANQDAAFHVTLHDRPGGPPARVALRAFDAAGTLVVGRDVVLQAGESTTMRIPGPGVFRAHAQIVDSSALDLIARRQVHGSVEVFDEATGETRPTCSFDPWGLPPGR
jgi:hypothetical protein